MDEKPAAKPDPKAAAKATREARLAAALRANLRRRKAAASRPVAGSGKPKPDLVHDPVTSDP